MSRSASTPARTEEIFTLLDESNLKAHAYIEIEVDDVWVMIGDLNESKGIDWEEDRKRQAYANIGLTPVSSVIDFEVFNKDGKYSDGSGTSFEGWFNNDTRVRLTAGYRLDAGTASTASATIASPYHKYFTKISGGALLLDEVNAGAGAQSHFDNLFANNYDTPLYDAVPYSHNGYAIYTMGPGKPFEPLTLSVTGNSTGAKVYYRSISNLYELSDSSNTAPWKYAGLTSNGIEVFDIGLPMCMLVAVAIVFDGQAWADGDNVTAISCGYNDRMEWVYRAVYYLDSPTFIDPPFPGIPTIGCQGRDVYKKALETELNIIDINGDDLDTVVKEVLDRVGIGYTSSSIDDLSVFGNRTATAGLGDSKTGDAIIEYIVQLINKYGETKYECYCAYDAATDDNILFIKPRPSSYVAVNVFSYAKYKALGSMRKNYDKLLSRVTVVSDEKTVTARELLGTLAVTTTGTKTVSWSGAAIYRTYEFSGGTHTATISDVTDTSIVWNFTAVTGTVTINVYGCKFSSSEPTYWGEWYAHDNMLSKGGITHKITNSLIISKAEAYAVARGDADEYGSPLYDASDLSFARLNLMLENNDLSFIWSRNLNLDRLFYVVGIKYHWDRSRTPGDSTTYKLYDTGRRFSDVAEYKWDDPAISWDTGYLWDMVDGPLGTPDTTDYDYLKPVEFS